MTRTIMYLKMNTGLVLSGGGARGIAHVGVIRALEEKGIQPTHIAGTSAGAIVGALYAAGCPWNEMLDFFKSTQIFSVKKYARSQPGIVDTSKFYDHFKSYFPSDSFESLHIPLYITATNLLDGTLKVFHSGELIKPILASAAVPGIFVPIQIKNGYYSDGGTLNNFPVDLIKMYCEQIIGVFVNPFGVIKKEDLKHAHNVMERAYHIMMTSDNRVKFDDCDILIRPENIGNFGLFSLNKIDTIFDIGYAAAKQALKSYTPNQPIKG
ncbi:patatin-like phospholipase family protein [Maribacter sp. CXY002]|uniref:patatin-like phospholipase family protein n=1 Tax=Maribacter luteocoastalis TaxID=3407671 RepID=UPI003B683305